MNILDAHRRFRRYCAVEEGLSPRTVSSLADFIKTFVRRSGATELEQVTLDRIQMFLYEGKERYQWSYWHYVNHLKYLRKFLAWCVKQGLITSNPALLLKKPKKPQALPRRLSYQQAQAVLYASLNSPWRYEYQRSRSHALIAVLLFAGLRAREALSLQLTDLNLEAGVLLVRAGKGNKDRYVPVHHKLAHVLQQYLVARAKLGRQSPFLLLSIRQDKPMSYKALAKTCQQISREAQVKFTAHSLRHTFGSVAIEQSMGLVQLKEIMGHSNISSTMIYLRMSPQGLKSSLNRLDLF